MLVQRNQIRRDTERFGEIIRMRKRLFVVPAELKALSSSAVETREAACSESSSPIDSSLGVVSMIEVASGMKDWFSFKDR